MTLADPLRDTLDLDCGEVWETSETAEMFTEDHENSLETYQ